MNRPESRRLRSGRLSYVSRETRQRSLVSERKHSFQLYLRPEMPNLQ